MSVRHEFQRSASGLIYEYNKATNARIYFYSRIRGFRNPKGEQAVYITLITGFLNCSFIFDLYGTISGCKKIMAIITNMIVP